ncbi:MAG: prepilin-type N-terminal cleavage/methylation domain-containing protein [Proteobacteria bacterium]|nr:prepilin-type N-terminal cleavage/methylation domain-containing protein [Pseudomonadota bacterium]
MGKQNKKQGFTIIEVLITVAIIGILAAVAIGSYGAYVRRSHNAEATAILADIRIKQEAYRATFHQYANLAADWFPNNSPGRESQVWPTDGSDSRWKQLGVVPVNRVYFSYYCEAGTPGDGVQDSYLNDDVDPAIDNLTDFWYAARAVEDLDGNGQCGGFAVYTGNTRMFTIPEGTNCPP